MTRIKSVAAVWTAVCLLAFSGAGVAWAGPGAERTVPREFESVVNLARATLALVERVAPRPPMAAELEKLERRAMGARMLDATQRKALWDQFRQLRRRILLSHPALGFDRILINKRTSQIPGHMCDQYLGRHSRPSPGLAILSNWKDEPKVELLLEGKLPPGATMHPDLSYDARRVAFGFCDHSGQRDSKQRSYFLYEATIDGKAVRQITGTASDPRQGANGRETVWIEDYDPCYLPGGGLMFISTRSQQFGRCHGSRYVPAYILYRCDADGSNIRQISLNEANEWDPAVLNDGRIVYCRWDYINRHDTNFQSLWVTRPDGTATGHYYGNYSVGPCMITEARAIPGSQKVVATATDHHGYTAGSIVVVDPYRGEDGGEPLLGLTPEIGFPERGAPKDTTFCPRPLEEDLRASGRGRNRAATPFPLTEELFLVAYPRGDQFAIYLIDTLGGRELIYHDPQISCFAPIPIQPTPEPPVLPERVARGGSAGLFFVQDIYQSTQPIERGTIRRLRVSEIISQPTRSKPILSVVNNEIIKRILGTVPVNGDGSVAFQAPADKPLQFQLLDENGMAVMTMRSTVWVRPGEMAGCVGCHESRHSSPTRFETYAGPKTFHRLQPPAGPDYEGGFSFVRTVQPVLDRHCIGCHGLDKTEGGVNLLGKRQDRFTASYLSLYGKRMFVIAQRNGETPYSKPKDYFAHAGRLGKMLLDGHKDKAGKPRVKLDAESFQRIVDWLDLNGQFYGDYSFNRIEDCGPDPDGEKALREHIRLKFGEKLAAQPFESLVNIAMPGESRILQAPLAGQAGGWGQITPGWSAATDPGYQEMTAKVNASFRRPEYRDVAGTCGRDKGCRCGGCWVHEVREAERREKTASTAGPGHALADK